MRKTLISVTVLLVVSACVALIFLVINASSNEAAESSVQPTQSAESEVSESEYETTSPEETPLEPSEPKESEAEAEAPEESPETPVAEEPLPLSGIVIGIDAGHQAKGNSQREAVAPGGAETKPKVSSGTRGTSTGIYEYELNLAVALKLEEELIILGADVVMLRRTNDVDISNQERAALMNEAGVDLCIRIHGNGSNDASVRGAMMLVPGGTYTTNIQEESLAAGEIIFESFLAVTGAKNSGVISRADMTGFNWSEVPVCLIELGYMTNPEEDQLLATDDYRTLCAQGLAEGVLRWHDALRE